MTTGNPLERTSAATPNTGVAAPSNPRGAMAAAIASAPDSSTFAPDPALIGAWANAFFSAPPGAAPAEIQQTAPQDVGRQIAFTPPFPFTTTFPTTTPSTTPSRTPPSGAVPSGAPSIGGITPSLAPPPVSSPPVSSPPVSAASPSGLPSAEIPSPLKAGPSFESHWTPASLPGNADLEAIPQSLGGVLSFAPQALKTASTFGGAPEVALPPGAGEPFYFINEMQTGAARAPASPSPTPLPTSSNLPTTSSAFPTSFPTSFPMSLPSNMLAFDAVSPQLQPERIPDLNFSARPFDPRAARNDFPILNEQVHGRPLIWLDNAATTQKPRAVIDRLSHFYEHENSNIHRGAHTMAARATDAYEAAREKTRRFLGAASTDEIIFVRGATEGINLVAQSWGRRNIEAGDEIIITWLEHHANIVPWQQLCAEKGARLRVAPVDDTGQIILEAYEKLFNAKTRFVSLTQVSNALGTVTPVREMVDIAHRHGAYVLVDGAQAVSHMRVNVQALDCDFYVFSGHKVFGPTGIGVVYGKADVLEHMPPWQGGGNMIVDVTFEKTIYQSPPARFEAGTGNIADAVGLGAAIDYLESIGMENVARYEHELLVYGTNALSSVPGLCMVGTAKEKAGVLSFVLEGHKTEEIGAALDREGIAVRSGHHCAQPILRRFGLESSVRPSLALYNTVEDLDALVTALLRLQGNQKHRAA
ncbi:Cysteine desulfurase [Azospirillaceae bacterium]